MFAVLHAIFYDLEYDTDCGDDMCLECVQRAKAVSDPDLVYDSERFTALSLAYKVKDTERKKNPDLTKVSHLGQNFLDAIQCDIKKMGFSVRVHEYHRVYVIYKVEYQAHDIIDLTHPIPETIPNGMTIPYEEPTPTIT